MVAILLGIVVTYIAAPLAAYCLIAPIYRQRGDSPFLVMIMALGFGPIGVSILLFFLFTIAPGQPDLFYVGCIVAIILLILIVRWDLLKSLLLFPASEQEIGVNLVREISIAQEKNGLKEIFVVAARMTPTIVGLVLLISYINELRSPSAFNIYGPYLYVALIATGGLVLFVLIVLIRDAIAIAWGLVQLLPATKQFALANLRGARRGFWTIARIVEDHLVVVFGAVLTAILLAMILYTGLAWPLIDNDPIEYALVSRAIYAAKSLSVYPIFTGQPDSGLYAAATHPPAFHLLHVWGYFFDGPNATRMLRLSPLFYFGTLILLMSALLMRYGKLAAVLGGLFVLSTPYFAHLAIIAHIDPMRIFFFFLSLALIADIIKHPNLSRVIVCGFAVGFAFYLHSLGIVSAVISGSSYLLLAKNAWRDRVQNAAIIGVISGIVGGSQYVRNFLQFGVPVLEYEPVWRIPELLEMADLSQRRRIG